MTQQTGDKIALKEEEVQEENKKKEEKEEEAKEKNILMEEEKKEGEEEKVDKKMKKEEKEEEAKEKNVLIEEENKEAEEEKVDTKEENRIGIEEEKKEEEEEKKGKVQENESPSSSFSQRFEAAVLTFRDEGNSSSGSDVWWGVWWCVVVAALYTRLFHITQPNNVVWDEAHFGKMVSWYINGTFFMDVHPPGGKLLLTLFGYLGGYNGSHGFENPSVTYEGYNGIMSIRVGCAILGAGMVPLGFHSIWCLTHSLTCALLAGALITFDIGSITLSKFILLDPPLMFFILASFHGLCLLREMKHRPFSWAWWLRLTYTGVSLGCVVSVKFVGVFVVGVVGAYTCLDLWGALGNLHTPLVVVTQHFLSRVLCLILLPVAIYLSLFAVHDTLLHRAKNPHAAEEAHFSPGFQMTLKDNALNNVTQPREVAYGSIITLKTHTLAGVYLHSHNLTYPGPAAEVKRWQQVTGFRAKDHNNLFRVLFPEDDPEQKDGFYGGASEYVVHGDWVRLHHLATGALLSCSRNKSLVTHKHNLVYTKPVNLTSQGEDGPAGGIFAGQTGTTSASVSPWQMWRVQIEGAKKGDKLNTLTSSVKFLCIPNACALTWSKGALPIKWGQGQAEITCSKNLMDPYTNWIVEQHFNPYLPNATYEHLRAGFASRVLETHRVMTWVNGRLKPEGEDRFTSHRPWMWPTCLKSQVWYDVHFRIVLLGNPVIFWLNLIGLFLCPVILLRYAFCRKRGRCDPPIIAERKARQVYALAWLLTAYLAHYLPFYAMSRILYYHHYFPALQFSSMMTAVVTGHTLESLAAWMPQRRALHAFTWGLTVFMALLVISFRVFCYVGYGHPTQGAFNPDNSTFRSVRVFDAWEI